MAAAAMRPIDGEKEERQRNPFRDCGGLHFLCGRGPKDAVPRAAKLRLGNDKIDPPPTRPPNARGHRTRALECQIHDSESKMSWAFLASPLAR